MFSSFFLAGFECTTGFNRHGQWIDQVAATRHDVQIEEDYRLLRQVGIRAAREGIRWPLVQRRFRHDFSTVDIVLRAARKHKIEIAYDLFHFGYPEGFDLFTSEFPRRFADYCGEVARYIARNSDPPYCFTPINEPSYFAWAAGEVGLFAPYVKGRGEDLKRRLIKAAIQGVGAIRDVCPGARILNADPICNVVPENDDPEEIRAAEAFNSEIVYQSWDMLYGRRCPELGGTPAILDIVGVNYYWTNQWVLNRSDQPLEETHPCYRKLSDLISSVAARYPGNPIIVTETSHVGSRRSGWIEHVADEAEILLKRGIPLKGICLYPILGMPEWHAPAVWTHMGLWDLVQTNGHLERVCHEPMLASLRAAQRRFEIRRS